MASRNGYTKITKILAVNKLEESQQWIYCKPDPLGSADRRKTLYPQRNNHHIIRLSQSHLLPSPFLRQYPELHCIPNKSPTSSYTYYNAVHLLYRLPLALIVRCSFSKRYSSSDPLYLKFSNTLLELIESLYLSLTRLMSCKSIARSLHGDGIAETLDNNK